MKSLLMSGLASATPLSSGVLAQKLRASLVSAEFTTHNSEYNVQY